MWKAKAAKNVSAVLALADDVAVTAWHVVADARGVWAVCADGQRVRVIGCIHLDALRDLTLLKLEKPLILSAEVKLEWL